MEVKDIIIRELTLDEIHSGKPFSHFGWEGNGAFSFLTISDGYWEAAKVILQTMESNHHDFSVVDTLVYPFFFNYRHSVETFLKYMYFNIGEKTEEARKDILNQGHSLKQLWNKIRPILIKGRKHVGCTVDIDAIEHYIIEINDYDSNSMFMRYPIDKELIPNKKQEFHFDYIHFGRCMDELCKALRQIDYELSNQIMTTASSEQINEYLNLKDKYQDEIHKFIILLQEDQINENTDFNHVNLSDFSEGHNPEKHLVFLENCDSDLLILLDNLFYGGRAVNLLEIRLSTSEIERQKEFIGFCYDLLKYDGLKFGITPNNEQINIFGKTASSLLCAITTAISILELKPFKSEK